MGKKTELLLAAEVITGAIRLIRGHRVLLDEDIAKLYGTTTGALNQAVKRNIERFPGDFMFQLTSAEMMALRSQSVISNRGGRRYPPHAFTEQGVAMLSSVLHSPEAIAVNIQIMRVFVHLRQAIDLNRELARRLEALEAKVESTADETTEHFRLVFEAIRQLMDDGEAHQSGRMGFEV